MRLRLVLITLLAATLLAPAGSAMASHGQVTSFEAPRDFLDPAMRATAFNDISSFGVHSMRVVMYWQRRRSVGESRVKPSSTCPTRRPTTGAATSRCSTRPRRAAGRVLLTLTGPVPRWATNGARDQVTRPSPNEFRLFRWPPRRRFGGEVRPGRSGTSPTTRSSCARSSPTAPPRRRRSTAASTSRRCAGCSAGRGDDAVLLGETAPRGTGNVVAPLTFLRGMLCLDATTTSAGSARKLPTDRLRAPRLHDAPGPVFCRRRPQRRDDRRAAA